MTPSASSPPSNQHGQQSIQKSHSTTGKQALNFSNFASKNLAGYKGKSIPEMPVPLACTCCPAEVTPVSATNQGLPGTTSSNPGASSARASTNHESTWDEGTVYGRLICPNCQAVPANDRDRMYRARAAQAISDFEKKFQRA